MRGGSVPDLPAPLGRTVVWAEPVPQCCWPQQSLWPPGSSVSEEQRGQWKCVSGVTDLKTDDCDVLVLGHGDARRWAE